MTYYLKAGVNDQWQLFRWTC